jgi:large subunit ribosomal protein L19
MNQLDQFEAAGAKQGLPNLEAGDTVRVHVKVKETMIKDEKAVGMKGKGVKEEIRERVQVFEGLVIALRGSGARATVTVRKISFGEGVERIFPLNAPTIDKIEVVKKAHVRRAKLYYLRGRKGKEARMREKRVTPAS